jgi:hypothetical protein
MAATMGHGDDLPQSGVSADGSLRFENRTPDLAGAHPSRLAPTAYLWDAATGAPVADGSTWTSSRITPQPDGMLLFSLRHRYHDALFRLNGARRTFRILGEPGSDKDLAQLAEAIARAHQASLDKANTYMGVRIAPDGSLRIDLVAVEWFNSHWVHSPRVTEVATGRILLDLWNTDWDAEVIFPRERCVSLALRRYQSRIHLRADLDLASGRFIIFDDAADTHTMGSLPKLRPELEAASLRAAAAKTAQPVVAPSRIGPRQIRVALSILIGALTAIAVLSFAVVRMTPSQPQKLTPLPVMPDVSSLKRY